MTNDMKQLTKMMEDSKDELSDLMKTGIELKKQFMEENEADLKEISKEEAEIKKEGITITAKAIRDGLKKEERRCKECGKLIDEDSNYCKHCGKEQ